MVFAAHIAPIAGAVELVCGSIAPLLSSEAELAHLHHARTVLADLLAAVQQREGNTSGAEGATPLAAMSPVALRAVSSSATPRLGSVASSRTGSQSGARSGSARFTPLSRTGSGGVQPSRNGPIAPVATQPIVAKQSVSLMGKSDHERLELQAQMLAVEDHDEQQVEVQRDRSAIGFMSMGRRRSYDRTSSTSSFVGASKLESLRRMDSLPLPSRGQGSHTGSQTMSMRPMGPSVMQSPATGGGGGSSGGGRLGAELLTAGAAPERRGSLQRDEKSRILQEASMLAEARSQERDEEKQNDSGSARISEQKHRDGSLQEQEGSIVGSEPSTGAPHRTASASLNFFSRWASAGFRSAPDAPGVTQVVPLSAAQAAEETVAKQAADKDNGDARHASQTSAHSVAFDPSIVDPPEEKHRIDLFGSCASLQPGQIRTPGGTARFLSQRDVDPYNTVQEGDDVWVRQKKRQAALLLKYEHGLLFKDEGVIHPDDRALRYWNMCIFAWIIYSAIMVPLSLGFDIDKSNWLWLDCIMEVQLLGDIYINLHTGYVDKHTTDVVLDISVIRPHYLKGWFLVDACGSVPVELIAFIGGGAMSNLIFLKILRLSKVFRLVRLMHLKLLDDLEQDGMLNPSLLRLFKLLASFILVIHFITCAYWGIVRLEGPHSVTSSEAQYGSADTLLQWLPDEVTWNSALGRRYMHSLHWAIMSLLGGDTMPQTSLELLFTVSMLMLGITVFASIVGSASSLLANLDAYAEAKKTQLDSVKQYLRYRRVGKALQNKICLYFEYLWVSGQSVHHKRLFDELPESLSLMLNLSLKRKLIENCPMFRECTAVSVVAVIRRLIPCIALPEEMIVRQGDRGDRMFFVVRGALQVFLLQPNGNRVVVNSLGEGAQFGELALLSENNERTACVVALTFCELEVLTDIDFHELELQYPDIASHVRKIAQDNASRVRRQAEQAPSSRQLSQDTPASPRSLASRLVAAAAARMPSIRNIGSVESSPRAVDGGNGRSGKRNSLIGKRNSLIGKRNSLDPSGQQKADEVMEAARASLVGMGQSERLSGASALKDDVDNAVKAIRAADHRRISQATSPAPAAHAPAAHASAAHAPAARAPAVQRPSDTGIEQDLQQIVELHQRSGRSRMSVDSTAAAPAHEPTSPSKPGNTRSWDQSKGKKT